GLSSRCVWKQSKGGQPDMNKICPQPAIGAKASQEDDERTAGLGRLGYASFPLEDHHRCGRRLPISNRSLSRLAKESASRTCRREFPEWTSHIEWADSP